MRLSDHGQQCCLCLTAEMEVDVFLLSCTQAQAVTLTVAQAFQMALDLWEAANAGRKEFLRHFPWPSLGIGVFSVGPCLGLCGGEMARCLAGEMH